MKKVVAGILAIALCLGIVYAVEATGPGSNWGKYSSNPVITRNDGSWDSAKAYLPNLIVLAGNPYSYVAFYTGNDGGTDRIGVATSTDLVHWTKYPATQPGDPGSPILDVGDIANLDWDSNAVAAPCVLYDGQTFRMWYTGSDGQALRLGLAESVDGTAWNKVNGGLVMDVGSDWESNAVGLASVIYQDGVYKMWYSGSNGWQWAIGYATSPDGITWTKYGGNPVLPVGNPGNFDSKGEWLPSVIYKDGQYQMFYTGIDDNDRYKIGYATSSDGITWTRSPSPIISTGASGSFDEKDAWALSAIYSNNAYLSLYTGVDANDNNQIGLAVNIPPKIQGPVAVGDTTVSGWGTPGATVSIYSYPSGSPIGSSTVASTGRFAVTVPALTAGTSVDAVIGSDHSDRQIVMSIVGKSYLPAILYEYNQGM